MSQITKEQFCTMINRINQDFVIADTCNMVLKKANFSGIDFFDAFCLFDRNIDFVVDLLEVMFNDECGWISYVCFECGGDYSKFEAWDVNDRKFYVRNSADLYELIVNDTMVYDIDLD